eukprot:m.36401 g.36401  ORF g.36401 m.36401 type:complete len:228 (-) comp11414_c0_seq1:396-1079(-)
MGEWYHGAIGREAAEHLLLAEGKRHVKGDILYLVRKSQSCPKDFVLTWLKVGECIGNTMIKVVGCGGDTAYILDIVVPGKSQRYFASLERLLEFYQDPACGLPDGYLQSFVPCDHMPPLEHSASPAADSAISSLSPSLNSSTASTLLASSTLGSDEKTTTLTTERRILSPDEQGAQLDPAAADAADAAADATVVSDEGVVTETANANADTAAGPSGKLTKKKSCCIQ